MPATTMISRLKEGFAPYSDWARAMRRSFVAALPSGALEGLSISTTNEDVKVSDIALTGSASLSSNGGDVIVDDIDVGTALALSVKNGDIKLTIGGN